MIGHKLCPSCYDALNHIEDLYASFRISADIFLDKFLLGQKALEADLVGLQQINDLTHLPGCLNLPLNKIVIKVCTRMFKFLNQCFARLRFWKSVSSKTAVAPSSRFRESETLFQTQSRAKHWFKKLNILVFCCNNCLDLLWEKFPNVGFYG